MVAPWSSSRRVVINNIPLDVVVAGDRMRIVPPPWDHTDREWFQIMAFITACGTLICASAWFYGVTGMSDPVNERPVRYLASY